MNAPPSTEQVKLTGDSLSLMPNVGVVFVVLAGPLTDGAGGGVVSTVQWYAELPVDLLPTASEAKATRLWLPSVTVYDDGQADSAPPSTAHV